MFCFCFFCALHQFFIQQLSNFSFNNFDRSKNYYFYTWVASPQHCSLALQSNPVAYKWPAIAKGCTPLCWGTAPWPTVMTTLILKTVNFCYYWLKNVTRFALYRFFSIFAQNFWKKLCNLRFTDFIFSCAICACAILILFFLVQLRLHFSDFFFYLRTLHLRFTD